MGFLHAAGSRGPSRAWELGNTSRVHRDVDERVLDRPGACGFSTSVLFFQSVDAVLPFYWPRSP